MSSDARKFLLTATTLRNLTLENNPWHCDRVAYDFLRKVKCNGYDTFIIDMTPKDFCPLQASWIITIAILGIITASFVAIYYRYQLEIKIWLYAHKFCLCLVTEEELDRNKIYDAFVCYSHKDDDVVENNLLQKLEESQNPYKLCVYTRDWISGDWIPAQITRSIEKSRRIIVVLTPNFVESYWGRMEFCLAHLEALKERRWRVIIVVYGEIGPIKNLEAELRAYIKMNTYIKWGDPRFWQKLKYALSDPSTSLKFENTLKEAD